MAGQFSTDSDVAFPCFETIDRTYVVESTAGHVRSRRCICTGHDPTGAQRNGVNFVSGVGIPYNQFAIL